MSAKGKLDRDAKFCITGEERFLNRSEKLRIKKGRVRAAREAALSDEMKTRALLDSEIALANALEIMERSKPLEAEQAESESPELARIEIDIQVARIAGAEARWNDAIAVSRDLLSRDVPGVWRLTVHQLLANALFESGNASGALHQVEQSRGLQELYPHSPVVPYLVTNEAKALAVLGRVREASECLRRWIAATELFTIDNGLTVLRAKSFLALFDNDDIATAERASVGCYAIAHAMGDDLYAGLALAELSLLGSSRLTPELRQELTRLSTQYIRIKEFLTPVMTGPAIYATAQHYRVKSAPAATPAATAGKPALILDLDYSLWLRPDTLASMANFEMSAQERKIFSVLAESPTIEKDAFFKKVWGIRFDKNRHKTTLTMALNRFRKKYSLTVRLEDGIVSCESLLVL